MRFQVAISRLWRIAAVAAFSLSLVAGEAGVGGVASRFAALAPAGTVTVAGSGAVSGVSAGRPVTSTAVKHDLSAPLRSHRPDPPQQEALDPDLFEPHKLGGRSSQSAAAPGTSAADPVRQSTPPAASIAAPTTSFEGISNVNGVLPPDTNGDIGPNQYVQWVNLSFAIYSRSGTLLYGPAAGRTLWSGFGAPCETTNNGDPIAQYDHLADRWMMSQFALPNYPNGPFYQCIAVSQTGDPTGAWYRYAFKISDTKMNDYPHFGVWPDGYYMSTNQFTGGTTWGGQGVVVFERDKMLAGQAARMIYFDLFGTDVNLGGLLPSDLDGSAAPAGAPNVFVTFDDNAQGYPTDQLEMWSFATSWPAATATFTKIGTLPTAAFDSNMCGYARNCVPQQGTTVKLDALSDRLMYRLQYRNFGGYQTLVVNHTVDVNGADLAGVRWYELRNSGSGWSIRQQSTFSPDSTSRWMASTAMNANGDIAIGYSASSSTMYPAIRYTGRLSADTLNLMTQGEGTLMAGTGAQTHSASRWGDYSMLSVDPVDGCTFWYTSEYLATTGSAPWRTRIGSFQLPGCGAVVPAGTISGTVTDASTALPLSGATVAITAGGATTTNANGAYQFANLAVASYTLTASKSGYVTSAPANVSVGDGQTSTANFALTPQPITNTGWRAPTANAAVTSGAGDNNGYQTSPTNAYLADGLFAVDPNSGTSSSSSCTSSRKDKHLFYNFGINLSSSAVVKGIEVTLTGKAASTSGAPKLCVQLSSDGGVTWTAAKSVALTTTNTARVLGSSSDLWGRTSWTAAQLANASFRVRIIDVASTTTQTFSLDAVSVRATYQ